MIERWWSKTERKFPHVELGDYVLMPNHIHGVVAIVGAATRVRPLQEIIQWFKTMTTNEYIQNNPLGWALDEENPANQEER